MNAITAVSVYGAQSTYQLGSAPALTAQSAAQGCGSPATGDISASGASVGTTSISSIQTSLMESIQAGGGASTGSTGSAAQMEQLLRTLIAAILLLSLLDQGQQSADALSQSLSALGSGAMDQSAYAGMFYSSSYLYIQETSMTMTMNGGMDMVAMTSTESVSLGAQLDLSA